jgi:hypothetical protein
MASLTSDQAVMAGKAHGFFNMTSQITRSIDGVDSSDSSRLVWRAHAINTENIYWGNYQRECLRTAQVLEEYHRIIEGMGGTGSRLI